jgi:hypothetical protein
VFKLSFKHTRFRLKTLLNNIAFKYINHNDYLAKYMSFKTLMLNIAMLLRNKLTMTISLSFKSSVMLLTMVNV